jgi:pyruvate dehydrogenase E2 component (dihydrolipoamide acetyltransferase)
MYIFKFADIGEGIHEGKILEWKYKVGDQAEEGETLVIIETDKVNAEIPLPVDGKIKALGPKEGEIVHVGDMLAEIDDGEGEEFESSEKTDTSDEPKSKEEPVSEDEDAGVVGALESSDEVIASSTETVRKESKNNRVLATPVARKMAADLGVDIQKIKGTGEHGRVLKTDIENYKPKSNTPSMSSQSIDVPEISSWDGDKREKITTLRRSVVKAMTQSKQVIPHTTLIDELDVTELVKFRTSQKEKAADKGIKLTYMAFIIKALTNTIKAYPILNSSYDQINEEIIYRGQINVGIAVDTPDGLIVPNIKSANELSIYELAEKVDRLASLAKERKIQLSDLQKGTISITNFGAFGTITGTPIIKHPEVAILGIGKITKKPVVVDNEIVIRDILPLSLTFDHRIIDGADGGRAMKAFKENLKDPLYLLMN